MKPWGQLVTVPCIDSQTAISAWGAGAVGGSSGSRTEVCQRMAWEMPKACWIEKAACAPERWRSDKTTVHSTVRWRPGVRHIHQGGLAAQTQCFQARWLVQLGKASGPPPGWCCSARVVFQALSAVLSMGLFHAGASRAIPPDTQALSLPEALAVFVFTSWSPFASPSPPPRYWNSP